MNNWTQRNSRKLYCVTVDHGLRPEALDEALYVREHCNKLGVYHEILTWEHPDISEGKLENAAREARYQLISDFCRKNGVQIIATGHNWNDQIETYEMRKAFGSHESGLAGMSQVKTLNLRLKLIRPLLSFSKKALQNFLKQKNIDWKTDPMNFQEHFRRVAARNRINSYDDAKLNQISEIILNYGRIRHKTESTAVKFLRSYCDISDFGYCCIDFNIFLEQPERVQIEVLKRLIWNVGGKQYMPSIDENMLEKILSKQVNTIGRCFIKIKKNRLFVFRENRNIEKVTHAFDVPWIWDNRFETNIKLGENQFVSSAEGIYEDIIPKPATPGFPCLFENHVVKYQLEEWVKLLHYIVRPGFFDVYCGVSHEQQEL